MPILETKHKTKDNPYFYRTQPITIIFPIQKKPTITREIYGAYRSQVLMKKESGINIVESFMSLPKRGLTVFSMKINMEGIKMLSVIPLKRFPPSRSDCA